MDCLFCKILNDEIPSYKIYENEYVYAFLDIFPASNGHTLVIPKKHFDNYSKTDDIYLQEISIAKKEISKLLEQKLDIKGFNFLSNQNEIAGQVIFHYHEHIIPKFKVDEGYTHSAKNKVVDEIEQIHKKLTQ